MVENRHWTVSLGVPDAEAAKLAVAPTSAVTFVGSEMILGGLIAAVRSRLECATDSTFAAVLAREALAPAAIFAF